MKRLNLKHLLRRRTEQEATQELPYIFGTVVFEQWHITHVGGRGTLPAVDLSGPGVDDLVHALADALAESIHYGDGRAQAWTDYLVTRGNLVTAMEDGLPARELEPLEDAVADAWDRLVPELPATVRLRMPEARRVAEQLDAAADRIGLVTP